MLIEQFTHRMLPEIENELHKGVAMAEGQGLDEFHHMLAYHLGWEGEGAGPESAGKRIRPLLVLLVTAAAGGEWQKSIPAAAAIELVHNFSLIHDDIEDRSPLRRSRPTVWKKWGIPQAVNTGDAMFSLAHLVMLRLEETTTPAITLRAARILQDTCLRLTQGQYLDISYESRLDLTLDAYWSMVMGKTAALLAACTACGALIAEVDPATQEAYRLFGETLGLAFQAQDDLLGIWGDSALTGKSVESDLVEGKKTLPVIFGLKQAGQFAKRWAAGPIKSDEVIELSALLASEGALEYTRNASRQLTEHALNKLHEAHPQGEAGQALVELAQSLLSRKV